MKCKYCFSDIPNNATFCRYCGSVLDASANARVQQAAASKNGQVAAPVKKHTFRKFLLFLFVSFLVLSLVAYALIFIFFPAKRYYVNELVVKQGDSETISSMNHRGFVTKKVKDGKVLLNISFDNIGRISVFRFNHNGVNRDLQVPSYSSYEEGSDTTGSISVQGVSYEFHFEYTKQNNLTFFSIRNDNEEFVSAKMEYNTFGVMTKSEIYNQGEKQIREYDYKGDLLLEENYHGDTLFSSYTYENRVLKKSSEVFELDGNQIKSYVNTTYDENGIPVTCETFNSSNEMISFYFVEAETDNLITFAEKDEKTGKVKAYREYHIDSDGKLESIKQLDENRLLSARIEISYDRDGNISSRKTYDGNGNQISSSEYSYKKIPLFLFD